MKTERTRMSHLVFAIAFVLTISSAINSQAQSNAGASLSITDDDKAQIIHAVLMEELSLSDEDRTRIIKPSPTRTEPCKDSASRRTEYISSKNISASLLPKLNCINFILLGPEELERKSQEGIQYLSFDRFEVKGSKVEVRLATVHAKGKFFSTTGVIYEFRKVSGRWRGEQAGGYASMT
ncbi:MAG: hypothetical protein U0Z53_01465 [Blastocatellia bacterium]